MKLVYICLGSLLAGAALLAGLTLPGCESDPILAPQSEVADDGGSYGNTNLPPSSTKNAKTDINPAQNSDTGDSRRQTTNPERF